MELFNFHFAIVEAFLNFPLAKVFLRKSSVIKNLLGREHEKAFARGSEINLT